MRRNPRGFYNGGLRQNPPNPPYELAFLRPSLLYRMY